MFLGASIVCLFFKETKITKNVEEELIKWVLIDLFNDILIYFINNMRKYSSYLISKSGSCH
jgi:hypothetical protein